MTDEHDEDQRWLDLMAGREVPDAGQRLREEAAWLRAALLAYRAGSPAGRMPDPATRVQRLLQRAVEAGVLEPAAARGGRRPSWLWRWFARVAGGAGAGPAWRWPAGIAVALALGGLLLVPLEQDTAPEGDTLRSGAAVQTIVAPAPAAARDRLLAELRAAGLDAAPYDALGRVGIDVELAQPLPPAAAALLRQHGLQPPAGPQLRVEFVAPR
jgi:hypothetical protein